MDISILTNEYIKYDLVLTTNLICALYIFLKSTHIKISVLKKIEICCFIVFIPFISSTLRFAQFPYHRIVFLLLCVLSFLILDKRVYVSIPNCFIAIGISCCFEIISALILSIIFYSIGFREIWIVNEFCSALMQILLTILLMKIPRMKNGFTFFENKNNFGIGLLISGPIIVLVSLRKEAISNLFLTIIAFGMFVSIIGLFIWIRSSFIRHYRKKLKLRAEEYSKLELAEKEKEIEKLSDENTSLSSIIHLDNHIIQSIEKELKALNNPELKDKLLISINQRNDYVNNVLIKSKNLATTGNAEIDAVLTDLYIKAASRGIDFTLNVDCDINYLISNIIEQDDFEKLISNCIKNSIVDIEKNPDAIGKILIKISKPNDIYEFTIMDNGISKDDNSKSISDIIEKSNASIKTNEFANNETFTKSLTVRFDGLKNHKI